MSVTSAGAAFKKALVEETPLQIIGTINANHALLAKRALGEAQVGTVEVQFVPGSFEIPLAAQYAFDKGFDAVVAVGLVLKGETPHFDYVCQGVTQGVIDVSLKYGKPIGYGILMCNDLDQAIARSGVAGSKEDKGYDSAVAALELLRLKNA